MSVAVEAAESLYRDGASVPYPTKASRDPVQRRSDAGGVIAGTGSYRPIADIALPDQDAGMGGFSSDIPVHLLEGAEIWTITVGTAAITFDLRGGDRIVLQPYGMTEDKNDWLYNLKLSGDESLQALAGQTIESVEILSERHARVRFSGGRSHDLIHDDPRFEIASFRIGNAEYFA